MKAGVYGPLAYLLKNRTYLGETGHKGSWFPGEHEAIVDRNVFEQAQELLKTNSLGRTGPRLQNAALLTGLLFDDRGNRMSPSFTVKNGVRYPFYVSSPLLRGRKDDAGSVARVSATDLERLVLKALQNKAEELGDGNGPGAAKNIIQRHVSRIVIHRKIIAITHTTGADGNLSTIEIPWSASAKNQRSPVGGINSAAVGLPNQMLLQALVRAHTWNRLLLNGTHKTVEALARSIDIHPKIVRTGIRMAFLAPHITKKIMDGEQHPDTTLKGLVAGLSLSWLEQERETFA